MSKPRKAIIALLIPAHNEAVVISDTLQSAIDAGMNPEHIYVVDDNSEDGTAKLAREVLPKGNVCRVRRSGKGLAIQKAVHKFQLSQHYRWIHIADADGRFANNYFRVMRRELRVKNAAATGYIRSLEGRYVSQYRVFEYTLGMEIHRRVQAFLGVIPIIPGPTSCFRSDVLSELDFNAKTLTEDFDVTLQIYRQSLGKIQFIPDAKAFTQDPYTLKDFMNQIIRWNRGVLQVMLRHKSFRHFAPVDLYLKYQIIQNLLFFFNFFIWVPYLVLSHYGVSALAVAFLSDVAISFTLTVFAATRAKRYDVIGGFPFVYALRWLSLLTFLWAFLEVVVLRKFRSADGIWNNSRYKLAEIKDNN